MGFFQQDQIKGSDNRTALKRNVQCAQRLIYINTLLKETANGF